MARQRLHRDMNHAEAFQQLNVASYRAAVALELSREVADGSGRFLDLLDQRHPLCSEDMQQRFQIAERDDMALGNWHAAIRQLRVLAPALEKCVHGLDPDFSFSHHSPSPG